MASSNLPGRNALPVMCDECHRLSPEPLRQSLLLLAVCITGSAMLVPAKALGDEFHYRDILIGDRAAGMGGAYTAVSDDTAGLYYNPAGIVHAGDRNLSGSVNAWHETSTTYRDVLGDDDWRRDSAALIPNFFGIVQPIERGVVGFSFVVTDLIREDQDQTFTVEEEPWEQFTINLNDSQTEYKIGPSWALELTDDVSIGGSLYVYFREQEVINNQLVIEDFGNGGPPDTEWRYVQDQNDEWGLRPVLGIMWDVTDQWAIGASIRGTQIISADNYNILICHGSSATDPPDGTREAFLCQEGEVRHEESESDTRREHPWETRVGVAWFHSPRWMISADFSYHTEHRDVVRGRTVQATWNAALGTEYYLNSRWALRGGIYTNRANTPSQVERFDHVNYVGGSLSLARFSRNSSITLGVAHSQGSGQGQVLPVDRPPQDVRASSTSIFLSSSYNF